ncbi:MAG: hypothetical protein HY886_07635 [Deltaproteobacteria bacterium]|nr:hypothetical protein [Deltaproteobacteria bacterium]
MVTAFKKKDTSHAKGWSGVSGNKGGEPTPSPRDVSASNIPTSSGEVKASDKPADAPDAAGQAEAGAGAKPSAHTSVDGKTGIQNIHNDPIEATGEWLLEDNPDMAFHAGTDKTGESGMKTARELYQTNACPQTTTPQLIPPVSFSPTPQV